ncbi:SurA N-terminal domain-containing protein [Occallatibacter riparius]|uniref:Peptidylprolyl isomerase n=1 Tax=Occallatibacter riparius TaxID=1002689 RepID=A0A9J7BLU3_9BACT|nr:peptidylprolyl isomerase [Occallatibacter riparius]UWZ83852.1 peptidylprolyl isomerase [Occallatibacter riparius]
MAATIALLCAACLCSRAQEAKPTRVLLDRVVAVVNNRAILASDVERAMRLSALEPRTNSEVPDARSTLDRLISRSLIQQQMGREEEVADAPTDGDVQARIAEIRKELPACVRANCATDQGWSAFLAANRLTVGEVESYLRLRLQFLSFIENRFRSGIHIAPEEIQAYYTNTLVPQYAKDQKPPALEAVSQRIEEILLQEQVNKLFSAWLDNLRKQGDVQILDPSLEMPARQASNSGDNE